VAVPSMNHLTSQEYADLMLHYWQELRKLPKQQREAKLDERIRQMTQKGNQINEQG
jgi:hypothetical protein